MTTYDDWNVGDRVIYHRQAGKTPKDIPDLPDGIEGRVIEKPEGEFPARAARVHFPKRGDATIDSICLERIL